MRLGSQLRDPVYGNAYALVLNSALASALGFAFWFVAARRFSAEALGWGAAVVSASTLAALIGKAGFDAAIIRYGPTARDRVLRKLLVYAGLASVALTGLVGLAILALAGSGVPSLAPLLTPAAAAGFLLLACGTAVAWILDAFFIAEQTAVLCLARNTTFNVAKIAAPFAVAAGFASFAVPLSWGAGLAASLLVALAVVPWSLRKRKRSIGASPTRREVAVYAGKNYVLNVSEFLPGLVLPILVLESLGPTANARFFLAWTIATVGFLASKAIAQSAFAQLVRDASPRGSLRKGLVLSAALLAPFAVLLLLGAPVLLSAFAASAPDSVAVLRLLALSLAPLAVTNVFLAYLKARQAGFELTLLPATGLVVFLAAATPVLAWGGTPAVAALWLVVQLALGSYAASRLVSIFRRSSNASVPNPRLRGHPHEG